MVVGTRTSKDGLVRKAMIQVGADKLDKEGKDPRRDKDKKGDMKDQNRKEKEGTKRRKPGSG